jgi:uncharacterized integral membrane protein
MKAYFQAITYIIIFILALIIIAQNWRQFILPSRAGGLNEWWYNNTIK